MFSEENMGGSCLHKTCCHNTAVFYTELHRASPEAFQNSRLLYWAPLKAGVSNLILGGRSPAEFCFNPAPKTHTIQF